MSSLASPLFAAIFMGHDNGDKQRNRPFNSLDNSLVASETSEGDLPDNHDAWSKLKLLRLKNVGRVIIGYLNINSIRNKLDALT